jgi:hypothetical protein
MTGYSRDLRVPDGREFEIANARVSGIETATQMKAPKAHYVTRGCNAKMYGLSSFV